MGKQNILTRSKRKKADVLLNEQRFEEARELFRQICKLDPKDAEAWFMLGVINTHLGELAEAVKCNQKAVVLRPDFAEAHFNLGNALYHLGHLAQAEASYKNAIRLNPDWPQALTDLGNTLQAQSKRKVALEFYRRALEIKPDYARAYLHMGNTLKQIGRAHEAETCYQQALEINPNYPDALKNMASMLFSRGKFDEALLRYQQLAQLVPGQVNIPVIKAKSLERQGQLDLAYDLIEPLIDQGKVDAEIALLFSSLCHLGKRCDEAIAILERMLSANDKNIKDGDRASMHFKLGALYDKKGDYDQAFTHFRTVNNFLHQHQKYDGESFSAYVDMLIGTFDSQFLKKLPRGSQNSERPVFIVGMPRSGTTLVEQILATHPQVFGAGELEDIRQAVDDLPWLLETQTPFPDCLPGMTQEACDQVAQTYLDHLAEFSTDARYVVNKMPANFLQLGFIAMLFPRARIIHCTRDPLDTCLSCYFAAFMSGHTYTNRLEDLGNYYNDYRRLMQHWKEVLDIPVLEVSNEALIADQEGVTRSILDFCDLEWDEACLRFYENKRPVNTISYNQVRRPIIASSMGRWKHYECYLEPLKTSLLNSQPEQNFR